MGGTFTCLAQDGLITHLLGGVARTNLAVRAVDAATKASHGVDWGAIITRIGVPLGVAASIAAILAIIPMTRTVMVRFWRALSLEIGLPYRRYAKKFIKQFGVYDNPYLGESEQFDLRLTYVPLLVQIAGAQTVKLASDVLADHTARRLIIIGDPGSGKSTLLKAYAVGVLSGRRALASGPKPVPYFIQVRKLAKFLSPERGLADFIVDEILVKGGYFRADMATKFFVDTLRRRRAIVMLDGLDEVHEALQPDVLAAVRSFTTDLTIGRPTAQAVVLLTCRTQNFKSLRENWVPAVASRQSVYSLVPLRDAEIIDYLHRFRHKFGAADGPAQFMKSVRAAGTLDRLRAPLILAMAVGLYARQPERMPSTVTELYKCMIEEMLDRNSFRHENPEYGLNRYKMRDKYRFLRQFSLHAVETSGEFIEFTRSALNKFAGTLTGNLEEVDDTVAMVAEIIKRSGLLSDVSGEESDGQRFVFAQEFFIELFRLIVLLLVLFCVFFV
jgi:hypothetical protein